MNAPNASLPLRDARTKLRAPCCASQRAVSSPRPLVPPVTAWPPIAPVARDVMRSTIFPVFLPLCSVRNASSY
eukprot:41769-Prymnesium_polylepis.1